MDELSKIGLTEYEKKVYETLLRYDSATAVRVAERSGVPKPKVYDTLRQLERRRLVAMVEKKPMIFQAIEPEIGINALIEEEKNKLASAGLEAIKYLSALKENIPEVKPTERFEILRGMEQRLRLTEQFIKSAKKEYLILSAFDFPYRFSLLKARQEACKRGVNLKAITTYVSEENRKMLKEYTKRTTLRHYTKSNLRGMSITIRDREESGIVIISAVDEQIVTIKIISPAFSRAMAEYFDFLWKNSEPLRL